MTRPRLLQRMNQDEIVSRLGELAMNAADRNWHTMAEELEHLATQLKRLNPGGARDGAGRKPRPCSPPAPGTLSWEGGNPQVRP